MKKSRYIKPRNHDILSSLIIFAGAIGVLIILLGRLYRYHVFSFYSKNDLNELYMVIISLLMLASGLVARNKISRKKYAISAIIAGIAMLFSVYEIAPAFLGIFAGIKILRERR